MKYCTKCGNQLLDEAVICPGCGCPAGSQPMLQTNENLLKTLSERYNINGVIWMVIGVIQILLGLYLNQWLLIVAVLNIISGVQDMSYSKTLLTNPKGIVEKVRPLTAPIITLVYNLIFGGVIGVAGSIYYLLAIRNFVLENEIALQD